MVKENVTSFAEKTFYSAGKHKRWECLTLETDPHRSCIRVIKRNALTFKGRCAEHQLITPQLPDNFIKLYGNLAYFHVKDVCDSPPPRNASKKAMKKHKQKIRELNHLQSLIRPYLFFGDKLDVPSLVVMADHVGKYNWMHKHQPGESRRNIKRELGLGLMHQML